MTACESSWPRVAGKSDSYHQYSRWMGSAAEGASELETGTAKTSAFSIWAVPLGARWVIHEGWFWSEDQMGLLESPGHSGASAGRGKAGKAANSASAWAEKISIRATLSGGWQVWGVAGSVIGTVVVCYFPVCCFPPFPKERVSCL